MNGAREYTAFTLVKQRTKNNEQRTMMTQPVDRLIETLAKPPSNMAWTSDGGAIIGARPGLVVTVRYHKVETEALMVPNLATTNTGIMLLILSALRSDWNNRSDWLVREMRQAAQSTQRSYAGPNLERRVVFAYDKQLSRATLTIRRS